jgi:2-keto-4-pentenoate hydratase
LRDARRKCDRLAMLDDELAPKDLEEGYAIQEAFLEQEIGSPVGFKIGASSRKAQELLSVSEPFVGCVLPSSLYDSPALLDADDYLFRLIEPEFAFRMARPLPARSEPYQREDVLAATGDLHPAIEVVTSAFGTGWTDVGVACLIADNGVHGALVLGAAVSDWDPEELPDHEVRLRINGQIAGRGTGANALGNPITALTWLAEHLRRRGRGLEAGQVVTTGVVTEFAYLQEGDEAVADFGSFGEVSVSFSAG